MSDDDPLGPPLEECPVCGAVGLPERIIDHDCQAFLTDTPGTTTDRSQ